MAQQPKRPEISSDLPPVENPRMKVDWPWVADEIRSLDGEWGKVGEFSSAIAWRIRAGLNPYVPIEEFEVTMRRSPTSQTRRYDLYLRVRK